MAGSRAYKRDNHGRFAGGGSAVKTTYGKAGGFASPGHRARVAQGRTLTRGGGQTLIQKRNSLNAGSRRSTALAWAALGGASIAGRRGKPGVALALAGTSIVASTVGNVRSAKANRLGSTIAAQKKAGTYVTAPKLKQTRLKGGALR